jgi:hypothetical protein
MNNQKHNQLGGDNPLPEPEGWLTEVLQDYFAPDVGALESPSVDFPARCREAALRGLEIARMHRERRKIEGTIGSLRDHLAALARLAGVRLDEVLIYLGVKNAEEPDPSSAYGLARLAQMLGMNRSEASLRMRIGFAVEAPSSGSRQLATAIEPALARDSERKALQIEPLLLACEAAYDEDRREMVGQAIAALDVIFATVEEP